MNKLLCFSLLLVITGSGTLMADDEDGFQARARFLRLQLANVAAKSSTFTTSWTGSTPDPEKHQWPIAIARLAEYGAADSLGNSRIELYKDRAPFHFLFVGMARIMSLYPQAPKMKQHKEKYLQNVWNRTDGYNAFTGEGTENHLNMNKTSGYLYAQHALGNPAFPDAAARLAQMKDWIKYYAKRIYQTGVGEWNSSTYGVYNLAGWLNLYDFAHDPEVREAARAVLDYYAAELALHYTQGVTGGSESRGNVLTSTSSGTDYLNWLWFGDSPKTETSTFWTGRDYTQCMHAATSTYRPPALAGQLARKKLSLPALYLNSKPAYLLDSTSYVKQVFYADRNYTLGTSFLPFGGWTGGDTQFCNWKMVSRVGGPGSGLSAQVVTGNGRYFNQRNGRGRTPYDQFIQHKNVLIQLTRVPGNAADIETTIAGIISGWQADWRRDFAARFPGDNKDNPVNKSTGNPSLNASYIAFPTAATQFRNGVCFVQLEKSFLAIRSLYGPQPTVPATETSGRSFVQDAAPAGKLCGLVMEAVNAGDYPSFAAFQDSVLARTALDATGLLAENRVVYRTLAQDVINAEYTVSGTFTEPLYDWGYGPTQAQTIVTAPPFRQPAWPAGPGHGRNATWTVNGDTVDLHKKWSVYKGPHLQLENKILRLTGDEAYYQVDFSGSRPVFTQYPAPAAKPVYEAEMALLSGGQVKGSPAGYSGTGYVVYKGEGDFVQWEIAVEAAGTYPVAFRYANGTDAATRLGLAVNGLATDSLSFAVTGSWKSWHAAGALLPLQAGTNVIRLTALDTLAPRLDYLEAGPAASARQVRLHPAEAVPETVRVYPNPAAGPLTIRYLAARPEAVRILLTSLHGQRLREQVYHVARGQNLLTFPTAALPAGSYLLTLIGPGAVTSRKVQVLR